MRGYVLSAWVLAFVAAFDAAAAPAQSPTKHQPWATFSPGAWKTVRTITETFDANGAVTDTAVTETKTTLVKVEEDGVTLEVEVAAWMAGNRLDPKPQTVKQGFYGEVDGQKAAIKELDPGEIAIEGRTIPCRIRQVVLTDPSTKRTRTIKVYYNDDVAPYVLKCETTDKDVDNATTLGASTMVVDALQMPCNVDDSVRSAAHVRTVVQDARGTTTTLAYTSTDVPGRIICQQSKEQDKDGRLVRRSVLELTGFGLQPEPDERARLFPRRARTSRFRVAPRGTAD
ncbi:MAG: hypothetical protein NTW96_11255 [Planctomycetia bacterium]|nr:hypothetical protein [Planctomycetia bacterium]